MKELVAKLTEDELEFVIHSANTMLTQIPFIDKHNVEFLVKEHYIKVLKKTLPEFNSKGRELANSIIDKSDTQKHITHKFNFK